MANTRTTLVEKLKAEVLAALAEKPMTSNDLAVHLEANYYTIRRAMQELEADDQITPFDNKIRNTRWTLGANNGPKSIIPNLRIGSDILKYTDIRERYVDYRHPEAIPQGMARMTLDIFTTWVHIARAAEHFHNGLPDSILSKRLEARKVKLVKARASFENMAFICNQMLDQPKLWDTNYLAQFPEDKDWDEFQPHLQQMLELIKEFDS
jgi:hypothetical protein